MYSSLVLGGTFDHFHAGHEKLISMALSLSKHVLIGLTIQEMNGNKTWGISLLPYEERKREIEEFVRTKKREKDVQIIPIHDVYGTTLEDKSLEAIVVTEHSLHGAELINEARKEKGLRELTVHICELFIDMTGNVLSSTRIREGLVNRSGFAYANLFAETLKISEPLKEELRRPLGEVSLSWSEKIGADGFPLMLVGDVVTGTAVEKELKFGSAWIDGISSREPYEFAVNSPYIIADTGLQNAPGTINHKVALFMGENLISMNTVFKVSGEEDLLTLVAIMLSPLGSRVVYGNPYGQKGITVVHVSEEKKEEIRGFLAPLMVK